MINRSHEEDHDNVSGANTSSSMLWMLASLAGFRRRSISINSRANKGVDVATTFDRRENEDEVEVDRADANASTTNAVPQVPFDDYDASSVASLRRPVKKRKLRARRNSDNCRKNAAYCRTAIAASVGTTTGTERKESFSPPCPILVPLIQPLVIREESPTSPSSFSTKSSESVLISSRAGPVPISRRPVTPSVAVIAPKKRKHNALEQAEAISSHQKESMHSSRSLQYPSSCFNVTDDERDDHLQDYLRRCLRRRREANGRHHQVQRISTVLDHCNHHNPLPLPAYLPSPAVALRNVQSICVKIQHQVTTQETKQTGG